MEKVVGISQRISISVMETAMKAALDGQFSAGFAADLASGEYKGRNRIDKARSFIGKLTARNPLFHYVQEHRRDYFTAIKYKGDRAIIFTALINSAYSFGFDTTTILGKYFHVQENVTSQLLFSKMSAIYASNRSLPNGLYCVIPMYIEAGLIERPQTGIYTKPEIEISCQFTRDLFIKSFFVNNPMLGEENYDCSNHPYFEFINYQ